MSNPFHDQLPDGFMDELLDQLHTELCSHLIKRLFNLTTDSSQKHSTAENNPPHQSSSHELKNFIFPNITRVGPLFLSTSGHSLPHILLLCQLITQGYFRGLTELDLTLEYKHPQSGDFENYDQSLAELHSLLPALLKSLPRLQSFILPKIHCSPQESPLFSVLGLFPVGQSSHLEKLGGCSGLNTAHFKYLALHSNFMFPSLTRLDIGEIDFTSRVADDKNDYSTMHYVLQWIEKSMPKLTHLSLRNCRLTTTDIATGLANSPILSRLESLDLGSNSGVKAEGWQALFSSPQFTNSQGQDYNGNPGELNSYHNPKLKTLKLDFNPTIKEVIPLLADSCPYLANLTTLGLDGYDLDDNSIQSLCESKWIHRLESLQLVGQNELTSESIRMIANCAGMKNLTSLGLNRPGQFSLDLLRYITQSQHISKLATIFIDLSGISFDHNVDQVLLDFFNSPKASALTHLFIDDANISDSTMRSILLSPMLSNLETVLVPRYRGSTNEWIDAFVSSPKCCKLTWISLEDCNLTDSNVLSIAQSPYLSSLTELDLSYNPALTDDSVKYLAQSGMDLATLYLQDNPLLTPLTLHHLAQSSQLISGLKALFVSGCPLIEEKHHDILTKAGWFDGSIYG